MKEILRYKSFATNPKPNTIKLNTILQELSHGEYDVLYNDAEWEYFVNTYYDYKQHGIGGSRSSNGRTIHAGTNRKRQSDSGMVQGDGRRRTGGILEGNDRNAGSLGKQREIEADVNDTLPEASDSSTNKTDISVGKKKRNQTKPIPINNPFTPKKKKQPKEEILHDMYYEEYRQLRKQYTHEDSHKYAKEHVYEFMENLTREESEQDIKYYLDTFPKYGIIGEESIIQEAIKTIRNKRELDYETVQKIFANDPTYIQWWKKNYMDKDYTAELKEKIAFVQKSIPAKDIVIDRDGGDPRDEALYIPKQNWVEDAPKTPKQEKKKIPTGGETIPAQGGFHTNIIGNSEKNANIFKEKAENKKMTYGGETIPLHKSSHRTILPEFEKKSSDFQKNTDGNYFYVKENGEIIEHKQQKGERRKDYEDKVFQTDEVLDITGYEHYLKTLKDVQVGKISEGVIGKTVYGDIIFTTGIFEKVFKKHGPFYLENLVATANNWDYVIENKGGVKGKINLLKEFENGRGVLIGGNINNNGVFVVTHYEPNRSIEKELQNERNKTEGKRGEILSREEKEPYWWMDEERRKGYVLRDEAQKVLGDELLIREVYHNKNLGYAVEVYTDKSWRSVESILKKNGLKRYEDYTIGTINNNWKNKYEGKYQHTVHLEGYLSKNFPKEWNYTTGKKEQDEKTNTKPKKAKKDKWTQEEIVDTLKARIGDVFEVVESTGSLWKSKGNVLFVEGKGRYENDYGFIQFLRQFPYIERAEDAGGSGVVYVQVNTEKMGMKLKNDGKVSYNSKKSEGISGADIKKEPVRGKEPSLTDSHVDMITDFQKKANKFVQIEGDTAFYIKNDGEKIEYKKPESIKIRDWRKWQFKTDEIFDTSNLQDKVDLIGKIQLGEVEKGIITKSQKHAIILTSGIYEKLFKKHGPFSHENLVATANEWDYFIDNRKGDTKNVNFLKKFSHSEKGLLIGGNKEKDGIFAITHYEPTSDIENIIQKELQSGSEVYKRDENGNIEKVQYVNKEQLKNSIASSHNGRRGTATANDRVYENSIVEKSEKSNKITKIRLNGSYNSSSASSDMGMAQGKTGSTPFKLAERIENIIRQMGTQYTRYVNAGSVGTFYTRSGNVAVQSVNDIDVVHHELSHFIDVKNKVTDAYKDDETVREGLKQVYLNEYPQADPYADVDLYMREGYAKLQEQYLMYPSSTREKYESLVEILVDNGYPLQKFLNTEMRKVLEEYHGLDDIDKIGAVVTNGKNNVHFEDFLNMAEKFEMNAFDAVLPFVKMEEQIEEKTDLSNTLYARNVVYGRISANIDPNNISWIPTISFIHKGLIYNTK